MLVFRYGHAQNDVYLPAPLAERLQRQVPASQRSRVVAQAVAGALDNQQRRLEAACLAANRDLEVAAISEEFDAIAHEATLPDWTAPRREHE